MIPVLLNTFEHEKHNRIKNKTLLFHSLRAAKSAKASAATGSRTHGLANFLSILAQITVDVTPG